MTTERSQDGAGCEPSLPNQDRDRGRLRQRGGVETACASRGERLPAEHGARFPEQQEVRLRASGKCRKNCKP